MNPSAVDPFIPLDDIEQVDLNRHALIEASAGTGKTYTIENLVVRLLKTSPEINIENILLVTFTEKATSELKLRIRQKIQRHVDTASDLTAMERKKLQDALDGFDNAAIFTIHGFCHTLLREFPFETGNLFEQELVDDRPLMASALRAQMREQWPHRYGAHLKTLLRLAHFSAAPAEFIRQTIDLAQQLLGDPEHETLIPDPNQMNLDALWADAHTCTMTLGALVKAPPGLEAGYRRLNIHASTKAAMLRDVVEPIAQTFTSIDADTFRLEAILSLTDILTTRHASGESLLARLVPQKWLKAGENLDDCPQLVAIQVQLEHLLSVVDALSHLLMVESIAHLRSDVSKIKAQNGWISYQDMLTRVAEFIDNPDAEDGIQAIRKRYRVAFVDEFQDTDVLQWRIFRTLFLGNGDAGHGNRLFLIGDPKQAIYGFRGADVFTYLAARQEMMRLAAEEKAHLYVLTTNWRSLPGMVAAYNDLFSSNAWFGGGKPTDPFAIGYTAVASPSPDPLPLRVADDASGRPPLNIVDLSDARSHGDAKRRLAGFIGQEIRQLVDRGGIRLAESSDGERPLHFGDIAILVRSQNEFALVEPMLVDWGIPYAYYRKPGLFQSLQAHWLSMLLRAVAHPQLAGVVRLALLTPFFDISPTILAVMPDLPTAHASQQLLSRWYQFAQQRRWGPLFQSIMEESGIILRHCTDAGWERMETDFQQLFDCLELSAYSKNLDIGGMVALLDRLRQGDADSIGDADIHQIEDERNRVQVLTMHVSKGLEFPIVFIAGGLTERGEGPVKVFHQSVPERPMAGFRKVIDLLAKTDSQAAHKEYQDENKRLYYVALTRSQVKLYIPFYPSSGNQRWIGPVCRFVSPSIEEAMASRGPGRAMVGWHAAAEPSGPPSAPATVPSGAAAQPLPDGRLLPEDRDFRQRKVDLSSFSSIVHQINRAHEIREIRPGFSIAATASREDDEPSQAPPLDAQEADMLPGGTRIGSMFHYILENIDFAAVAAGPCEILDHAATAGLIATAMARYRVDPLWRVKIAGIVANVLRMPIQLDGSTLTLGTLPPGQRRHEIEFFFPLMQPLSTDVRVSGCQSLVDAGGQTLIRGFVDLVFAWQGRFYIADWKSNLLAAGYDHEAMSREITEARYDLQYQLYSIATLRWLRQQLGEGFDPERQFGGALYFFIRGMKPGGQQGVFHIPAHRLLPLETLESSIYAQMAGSGTAV